jgi:negative regulator of flagellin synthesis FlgM
MANEISGIGRVINPGSAESGRVQRDRGDESSEVRSPAAAAEESVELADTARALARGVEVATEAEEVDMNRVAEIRNQLAEGRFQTDSSRVAERLLDIENLLGGR